MYEHNFLSLGEITLAINRCIPLELSLAQGGVPAVYMWVWDFNSPGPPLLGLPLNLWILVWETQEETQHVRALKLDCREFMEEIGAFALDRLLFQEDTKSLKIYIYYLYPDPLKKCLLR